MYVNKIILLLPRSFYNIYILYIFFEIDFLKIVMLIQYNHIITNIAYMITLYSKI